VTVRGGGDGRINIAAVACYWPGHRPHLFCRPRTCRRRKGGRKAVTWTDYRDLITAVHREPDAPTVWVGDNLNVHLAPQLADFAEQNKAWLRVYRMPAYAPELNPVEMSLSQCELRRSSFA
jgi:hypothetical protein